MAAWCCALQPSEVSAGAPDEWDVPSSSLSEVYLKRANGLHRATTSNVRSWGYRSPISASHCHRPGLCSLVFVTSCFLGIHVPGLRILSASLWPLGSNQCGATTGSEYNPLSCVTVLESPWLEPYMIGRAVYGAGPPLFASSVDVFLLLESALFLFRDGMQINCNWTCIISSHLQSCRTRSPRVWKESNSQNYLIQLTCALGGVWVALLRILAEKICAAVRRELLLIIAIATWLARSRKRPRDSNSSVVAADWHRSAHHSYEEGYIFWEILLRFCSSSC